MRKYTILISLSSLLGIFPVQAQIYQDKYENVTAPMEQIIEHSRQEFGDVPVAGADEDVKPQEDRYGENVGTMDTVTDRHFDVLDETTSPSPSNMSEINSQTSP